VREEEAQEEEDEGKEGPAVNLRAAVATVAAGFMLVGAAPAHAALPFDPTITLEPTTTMAGAPTGLHVNLTLPQNQDPDGLATAHLKRAEVLLPEGMRVSPAAATGLGGCTAAQIGLGTANEPTCPSSSQVGDVTVITPVLANPLQGEVYLGAPYDNPFESLVALYIVVRGSGVLIKLPGRVDLDTETGRVRTVFDENPQLPFEHLLLELNGGSRATLINPATCGSKRTEATMASWAQPDNPVHLEHSFEIGTDLEGNPCPDARRAGSGGAAPPPPGSEELRAPGVRPSAARTLERCGRKPTRQARKRCARHVGRLAG
jgi:hypothetical protein